MRPQSCPQEASKQPPRGHREANHDYLYFFVGRAELTSKTWASFLAPAILSNYPRLHSKVGVRGNVRFVLPTLMIVALA